MVKKRPQGIVLPIDTKLSKSVFADCKYVFVVDLQSYTGLACNELLHQLLFGTIADEKETVVVVVMKAKFAPRCQCGIGERKVDYSYHKHRFVKEGDGRIVLQLKPAEGSKRYRDELIHYLISIVPDRVYVHSEDYIDASCKVFSLITPQEETMPLFNCFDIGMRFDSHQMQQEEHLANGGGEGGADGSISRTSPVLTSTSARRMGTPSKSTPSKASTFGSATKKLKPKKQQDDGGAGRPGTEQDVGKVTKNVEQWLERRHKNPNDRTNLPKTRKALLSAISPFCTLSKPSDIRPILSTLADAGDLILCVVCQSARPSAPNSSSFYFTHKKIDADLIKHCHTMMTIINMQYTNNKEQAVSLTAISKGSFKERVVVDASLVVDRLVANGTIALVQSECDGGNDRDSFSNSYGSFMGDKHAANDQAVIYKQYQDSADVDLDNLLSMLNASREYTLPPPPPTMSTEPFLMGWTMDIQPTPLPPPPPPPPFQTLPASPASPPRTLPAAPASPPTGKYTSKYYANKPAKDYSFF
ncbi:hypothetical protein SAMD00019534_114240 [Acytostelium subglobosum LB1]|uniref:hypothetical protein n=1 Tax=Acytostelium subglobosum LB1 TaxID=1410327 RepID=UPI000644B734|nr:hypothetical protein SAMD00019534_114240 [Acytostelium subglobosum LB1]GAM28248.1 hypothetical protein SAMD00019534_114240 [Acytostelium subglobosum LB1]|eukprot:XP_012748882.1 hypothetical protein SAMD00019534_114240 [Acytostelium subglobosum LB1]